MGDSKLFAEERHRIILEKLEKDSKVLVQDLVGFFNVSQATIRTDLKELENANRLIRTHGGAIPMLRVGFEQNTMQKQVTYIKERQRIAKAALDHVRDGDTIAIDTGTTTYEFAKLLQTKKDLTIVTNDLLIATLLEDITEFNIIMLGGRVRKGFHCTVGSKVLETISNINVDTAFICSNAFNRERGFMTPSVEHAEIKKHMKEIALKSIMLMGSHKIGSLSLYTFARLSDIDVWITDSGISDEMAEKIRITEENLELIVA
jgi:DeoR family fructose operon transcriptional repressor